LRLRNRKEVMFRICPARGVEGEGRLVKDELVGETNKATLFDGAF
jgi:hypothetical protein